MSDPACRAFRELLGVYVVGAIEPNERSVLDAHLNQCYGCREELAGLAVLPALLHRIPVAEAEQLGQSGEAPADRDDPAPQVLTGLLDEVGQRRRARRMRGIFAAAAALIVAVGGSVAVSAITSEQHRPTGDAIEVVSAHRGDVAVTVKYEARWGGTAMWIKVNGVREWSYCKLWVTTAHGRHELAGGWLVGPHGDRIWYPAAAGVRDHNVTGFVLTSGGKVLMHIPAS